jgi:hypothetical protein
MPIAARYLYFASMDIAPERAALLDKIYDTEHVPALLAVPGVRAITRAVAEPFAMTMAGATRHVAVGAEPMFAAIYEIDSPDVLTSAGWAAAVEQGRWPTEVRPYTTNVRQVLRRVVGRQQE